MRIVKKYANRKLYDTRGKKYVAMDAVAELIKKGEEVSVIDNRTGQDITSAVLSQILARQNKDRHQEVSSGTLIQMLRRGGETVKDYSGNVKKWMGKNIDKKINEVLGKMNLATRSQIQRLHGRIDELLEKVEYLEQRNVDTGLKPVEKSQKIDAVVPPKETGR